MTLAQTTLDHMARAGFPLSDYQIEDAARCAEGNHFLFLDTGLGKTIVALAAVLECWKGQPVVVICPKIAVDMWAATIQRVFIAARVTVARKRTSTLAGGDFYIVPESLVAAKAIGQQIRDLGPTIVIIDESHYFKTPTASRTKAVYGTFLDGSGGIVEYAQRVWLLSGTPLPNGLPGELYPALRALAPERLRKTFLQVPGHFTFRSKFHNLRRKNIGRRTVWADAGARNLEEFRAMVGGLMTRRLLRDHLTLDEPMVRMYPLTIADADLPAELADRLDGRVFGSMEEIQETFSEEELSRMIRLIGESKAPAVSDLIKAKIDGGADRVLVGFWHLNVAERIDLEFPGCAVIDGSTPEGQRREILQAFEAGQILVLLGQIKAMGVAINLQHCHHVVLAESSWVPGDNHQFIARCHRRGQKNRVLVDWVVMRDSIDEIVQETLARKAADARQAMGQAA